MWLQSGLTFETQGVRYTEFMDLVCYLVFVQHVGDDILELIFMIAWSMWFNRNSTQHGSSRQSATVIVQKAQIQMDKFQPANHSTQQPREKLQEVWILPPAPSYKVNADGAVFSQTQQASVRVVLRDYEGQVTAAMSKKILQPLGH